MTNIDLTNRFGAYHPSNGGNRVTHPGFPKLQHKVMSAYGIVFYHQIREGEHYIFMFPRDKFDEALSYAAKYNSNKKELDFSDEDLEEFTKHCKRMGVVK